VKKPATKPPSPAAVTREHRDNTGKMLPGNPAAWQPGQSGNPAGRPSSGDPPIEGRGMWSSRGPLATGVYEASAEYEITIRKTTP
jgi:hypothetical protein